MFKEIIDVRATLKNKLKDNQDITSQEQHQVDYFNARGSVFVLIYAISKSIEIFLDKKVTDKFNLTFREPDALSVYQSYWNPIISIGMSFSEHLLKGLQNYTLTMDIIENALSNFTSFVQAVADYNRERIDSFAKRVS